MDGWQADDRVGPDYMSTWVIFGSGPTLDDADFDTLPANRIAVNWAVEVVPDCEYVSCVDPCRTWQGDAPFLTGKRRVINSFTIEAYGILGKEVEHFAEAEKVGGSTGTALAFAIKSGADKVITYGVGGIGRSKMLEKYYKGARDTHYYYSEVLEKCKAYAERHGVELEIR